MAAEEHAASRAKVKRVDLSRFYLLHMSPDHYLRSVSRRMSKWMPINESKRATSARLPKAAWESRQAEIMARYESCSKHAVGIRSALRWILDQKDPTFQPSEKQVEWQINKWKPREPRPPNANIASSDVGSTVMSQSPKASTSGGSITIARTSTIDVKANSRPNSPGIHEHNISRRSSAGPTIIKVATAALLKTSRSDTPGSRCDSAARLSRTESATASLSDSPQSFLSSVRHSSITSTAGTAHSLADTNDSAQSVQEVDNDVRCITAQLKRPRANFEHTQTRSNPMSGCLLATATQSPDDTENLRLPLLLTTPSYKQRQKSRLRSTLASIRITITPEQIEELLAGSLSHNPFSPGDRCVIEEAAYFFGVSQVDADAFILYYILWVLHADSPLTSERRLSLLKSCAMSANTLEDLDYVLDLLAREIRNVERLENTQMEVFLLRIVLAFGHKKRGNTEMMKEQLWKATRTFFDLNFFITKLRETADDPQQRIQLDLGSYYAVDFAFRALDDPCYDILSLLSWSMSAGLREMLEKVRSTDLALLQDAFMKQWPGTFGLQGEVMQNDCLRRWIGWCCRTLRARRVLGNLAEILIGAIQGFNTTISHDVAVYWLLWYRLQQEKYLPNCGPPWDGHMERMMGISAPELLFELVEMALQCLPAAEKRTGISRLFRDGSLEWLWRFSEGFLTLEKMSDAQLVKSFLAKLVAGSEGASQKREQQQKQTGNEAGLRTLMVDMFIGGMDNQHAPMESSIVLHQRRLSALTNMSRDPTMRSSETGSTISSLRRHARKFARRSGTPITTSEFGWSRTSLGDVSDSMSLMADLGPLVDVEGAEP